MKTFKFVWIFIALMLGSTFVFAQGWRNGRGSSGNDSNGQGICLNLLSELSDEQMEDITQLNTAHQKTMAELRGEMRSTSDAIKKNEIRGKMLQKVQAHRNEVRNLLTEKQQKQYDLLQSVKGNRGRGFAANSRRGRNQAGFGRGGFRCGR